jgi:hypothetical protein
MNTARQKTIASTIARLVHTLLATEPFDSLADLTDALKWRLAALRIRYTPDDIGDAYRLVATARQLPGTRAPRTRRHVERAVEPGLSRADAAAILKQAAAQLRLCIRTMPSAPWSDPDVDERERQAARERAWDMGVEL